MEDFFDIPTLIVIGVAIVVLFRLRQVLGTRVGHERPAQRPVEGDSQAQRPRDDAVVPLKPRLAQQRPDDEELRARKIDAEIEQYAHGDPAVADGLRAIRAVDPQFSPKSFIDGAKQAYEMILTAFAAGDRKTLRNLLEKEVYDGFEQVMAGRDSRQEKVDFTFVGLPKIEIAHANYDKRNALVTMQFHAEVISATNGRDGALLEGSPNEVKFIADEWTFARNPKSRDPNWKLVATNQLE
jgi:predicted lipid-binding transport protein (Tim44 family)